MQTVHDSIAKPRLKSRDGWNTKAPKTTKGTKLTGNYYARATPVVLSSRWIAPTA